VTSPDTCALRSICREGALRVGDEDIDLRPKAFEVLRLLVLGAVRQVNCSAETVCLATKLVTTGLSTGPCAPLMRFDHRTTKNKLASARGQMWRPARERQPHDRDLPALRLEPSPGACKLLVRWRGG
jgi:hypothetical protein